MVWVIAVAPLTVFPQTKISLPKNKYKVEDDIKLGRDASAQVDQQFPILNDAQVTRYVQDVERTAGRVHSSAISPVTVSI